MPRSLSPRAILEANRENSSDVFLVLLTFKLPTESDDIRVVNNTVAITSRTKEFLGCPFKLVLPDDMEYATTHARLELDNVDPDIWRAIRSLSYAPEALLEVILASEPDTVILATTGLKLREASTTLTTISGSLVPDTIWQVGYPEGDFDPPQYPGIFT